MLLTRTLEGFARMDVAGLPVAQMVRVCVCVWACVHGGQLKCRANTERKKRIQVCNLLFWCLGEKPQSAEVWRKISRACWHIEDQLIHAVCWIQWRWLKRLLTSACPPHLSQSLLLSEAGHDRTTDLVAPQLPQLTTYRINLTQRSCSQQRLYFHQSCERSDFHCRSFQPALAFSNWVGSMDRARRKSTIKLESDLIATVSTLISKDSYPWGWSPYC